MALKARGAPSSLSPQDLISLLANSSELAHAIPAPTREAMVWATLHNKGVTEGEAYGNTNRDELIGRNWQVASTGQEWQSTHHRPSSSVYTSSFAADNYSAPPGTRAMVRKKWDNNTKVSYKDNVRGTQGARCFGSAFMSSRIN